MESMDADKTGAVCEMNPGAPGVTQMEGEGMDSTTGLVSQSSQNSQGSQCNQGVAPQEESVCGMEEEMKALQEALVESQNKSRMEGVIDGSSDQKSRRKMVAMWVEGRSATLSALAKLVDDCMLSCGGDSVLITRNLILDVASRKYYGSLEGLPQDVDIFENTSLGPYWFWESRSLTDLPEEFRFSSILARKKRKNIHERLVALVEVLKSMTLQSEGGKSPEAKLKRARLKLSKTRDLAAIVESIKSKEDSQARKVLLREKREQEKIAERESKAALKLDRKEAKNVEALGFGSKKSLSKAQNLLKKFAQPKTRPDATSAQVIEVDMDETNTFHQMFTPCPPSKRICFTPCDSAALIELDSSIAVEQKLVSQSQVLEDARKKWKEQSEKRVRIKGMPPSWARKPNCPSTFHEFATREFGEDYNEYYNEDDIKVWRYKYLWFPCDSECPPYYGSWMTRLAIIPQRPFTRHAGINYEEDFDEGWEEEPDGESLSAEEEKEEEVEDESQDGFVVCDGYLSEDEGLFEQDFGDTAESKYHGAPLLFTPAPENYDKQKQLLESFLSQSKRTGKPFIISRLNAMDPGGNRYNTGHSSNSELLQSLRIRSMGYEKVVVPSVSDAEIPYPNPVSASRRSIYKRRPKQTLSHELTQDLIFLLKTAPGTKEKVVDAFLADHPTCTVSKACIRDKVAELSVYDSMQRVWVLKTSATTGCTVEQLGEQDSCAGQKLSDQNPMSNVMQTPDDLRGNGCQPQLLNERIETVNGTS